jgi:uncharacterized paraquat-inducible protein A
MLEKLKEWVMLDIYLVGMALPRSKCRTMPFCSPVLALSLLLLW